MTQGQGFAAYEPGPGPAPAAVTVRVMTAADVPACAALIVTRTGEPVAAREAKLRDRLHSPAEHHLVATDGSRIVGYGTVLEHVGSPDTAPGGFYLIGLIVDPTCRRRGIGTRLTRARLDWIAARAGEAWTFTNVANRVLREMHRGFGFTEVTTDFTFPGANLTPGHVVLLRANLSRSLCG